MNAPTVFYVAARATAMGFPKSHIYEDCRTIRGAVVSKFKKAPTQVCGVCLKRWENDRK